MNAARGAATAQSLFESLFPEPLAAGPRRRRPSIQQQFEAFHRANPHIYVALVRHARRLKARGKAVGIGCLWEVVRYFEELRVERQDAYKLNNNLRSRYARLIMEQESDLREFFDVRHLRAS